jgi:malic enzyme
MISDEARGMAIMVVASLLTALRAHGKRLKGVRTVYGLHGRAAAECVRLLNLGAHLSRIVIATGVFTRSRRWGSRFKMDPRSARLQP